MHYRNILYALAGLGLSVLSGCSDEPLNNPYPDADKLDDTYYTSFTERPKHLDPARSYSSNEWTVLSQIYEPPLEYDYLVRPYELKPLIASKMPTIQYLNAQHEVVSSGSKDIAYTLYTIDVAPGVMYQPHPALAINDDGQHLYHTLTEEQFNDINILNDFPKKGTRLVDAEDFVYQMKRLASPHLQSPIFGLMSEYIVGLDELRTNLMNNPTLDLRTTPLAGAKRLSASQYQITLKGDYPQFIYWLAMPFFSPMPWEADTFYAQPLLINQNIQLDWYPIGTGPYRLIENSPARRIILTKNPLYRHEVYPTNGSPEDEALGLTTLAGQKIPFIDTIEMVYEKESIPEWEKFLQGYYDASGIASDSFDQALQVGSQGGNFELTDELKSKGISLTTQIQPSIFYWGFNMLDPIVGGYSAEHKALRQAISIAMDMEEYVQIFLNGRAIPAQGLLPPGIYGHQPDTFNPIVYKKNGQGQIIRRPIEDAKALMVQAGYPNGLHAETGQSLVLFYDTMGSGSPDMRARYVWTQKQFAKLGIDLIIRDTQYNRFQDKMSNGSAQFFSWGWNADYPDPENFEFLLYGPNSKVLHQGENAANYENDQFDRLFEQHKNMPNGEERLSIISQMTHLIREDAPWVWGFYPEAYSLKHQWLAPSKPNPMARNTMKYAKIDPALRAELRSQWNQPIYRWVLLTILAGLLLSLPLMIRYRQMQSARMNRVRHP